MDLRGDAVTLEARLRAALKALRCAVTRARPRPLRPRCRTVYTLTDGAVYLSRAHVYRTGCWRCECLHAERGIDCGVNLRALVSSEPETTVERERVPCVVCRRDASHLAPPLESARCACFRVWRRHCARCRPTIPVCDDHRRISPVSSMEVG